MILSELLRGISLGFVLKLLKHDYENTLDLPCRFSGVTEEDLENVTITMRDVQAVLLSMFSAETILIGHSLESDLLALKVKMALNHVYANKTRVCFPC